jgi:hypothetical protein
VPVFATNTAGDQVLDLVPEWDYVDGGHLSAPADDFAAGWFAVAYAVEVRAGPSSGGFVVGGGGDPLGHGGVPVFDEVGVELSPAVPFASASSKEPVNTS